MQKRPSKLIVKDSAGKTVQLLPEPAMDYELDAASGRPLAGSVIAETVANLKAKIVDASRLDVTETEPDEESTASLARHSVISWLQEDSWTFTIDTEGAGTGARTGQIPFCLYGMENASLAVDWGDGTVSRYSSDSASANSCPTHSYPSAGRYSVTVSSGDFDRLHLWTDTGASGRPSTYLSTLKSVDTPLPALAGTHSLHQNAVGDNAGSLEGCFSGCTALEEVIPDVFISNPSANSLAQAFKGCTSLASIPEDIFECTAEAESVSECFSGCTALARIGSRLFASLTKAEDFSECFSGCTALAFIPQQIFSENRKAADFSGCFSGCTALDGFSIAVYSPFVEDASDFVSFKEGAERTVEVPDIGTAYSAFSSEASGLGLTLRQKQMSWTILVDTRLYGEDNVQMKIPFSLNGVKDASMKVNWGDGTVETLSGEGAVNECISHEYASPGEYEIRMESAYFDRLHICSATIYELDLNFYSESLKQVASPLPELAGVYSRDDSYVLGFIKNSLRRCFYGCSNLTSVPSGLFANNPNVKDFSECFCYCYSIQEIPSELFELCTKADTFNGCFMGCNSIAEIPSGLFAGNVKASDFGNCFRSCDSLASVPPMLFAGSIMAENFSQCFSWCYNLNDFELHIGSSMVSECSYFVSQKSGAHRTVYVPAGSATYSAFSEANNESSLGLTIVQE